ncbi:MAG: hypothetical protein ACTSVF_03590 [Candidatus Asgardarchaeia archaeon]
MKEYYYYSTREYRRRFPELGLAAAHHEWSCEVYFTSYVSDFVPHFVGLDPYEAMEKLKLYDYVQAIKITLHETIHATGRRLRPIDYRGIGIVLEEGTTEWLANEYLTDFIKSMIKSIPPEVSRSIARVRSVPAYREYVETVEKLVGAVTTSRDEMLEFIEEIKFRTGTTKGRWKKIAKAFFKSSKLGKDPTFGVPKATVDLIKAQTRTKSEFEEALLNYKESEYLTLFSDFLERCIEEDFVPTFVDNGVRMFLSGSLDDITVFVRGIR